MGLFVLVSCLVFFGQTEAGSSDVSSATAQQKTASLGLEQQWRGIVLYPSDLISVGPSQWVQMLKEAQINLLGIHADTVFEPLPKLQEFLESTNGVTFLAECEKANIGVEFELHALQGVLSRELFETHPEYFRMDADGHRQRDYNMCFTSEGAYSAMEKRLKEVTGWLKPTTHRYFFWTDDVAGAFCCCEHCKQYSPSEQALLYENRLLKMLRRVDPQATVAHLAYNETLNPPVKVKPGEGIFLEYAPIGRNYAEPLSAKHKASLEGNRKVFPAETVHVLEYWLDASMFSGWKRNALKEIPWRENQCERDLVYYHALGVRSVTTFGAWINKDYLQHFGAEPTQRMLNEYGSILRKDSLNN